MHKSTKYKAELVKVNYAFTLLSTDLIKEPIVWFIDKQHSIVGRIILSKEKPSACLVINEQKKMYQIFLKKIS